MNTTPFINPVPSRRKCSLCVTNNKYLTSFSSLQFLQVDISKHKNVTKWLARVRRTIPGYDEVQEVGNALIRKMLASK